jgi:lipoprotein NlpD
MKQYSTSMSHSHLTALATVLGLGALSACSTVNLDPAPVVDHYGSSPVVMSAPVINTPSTTASMVRPSVPNPITNKQIVLPKTITASALDDGKNHIVRKGDTLYSIALEHGLSYRELADWNGISNPSYIQLDQALRLTPPLMTDLSIKPSSPTTNGAVVVSPSSAVAYSALINLPQGSAQPTVVSLPASVPVLPVTATPAAKVPVLPAMDLTWQWPSHGKTITPYTDVKKGIDMAGNVGDPVFAAADGKIVYAGTALKGYGKMLIIKHNDVYLTAYAHNSQLLVKEDAVVKRGQKIAEMGNTESEGGQTKLHFEMRRSGKPVDPVKLLPAQ